MPRTVTTTRRTSEMPRLLTTLSRTRFWSSSHISCTCEPARTRTSTTMSIERRRGMTRGTMRTTDGNSTARRERKSAIAAVLMLTMPPSFWNVR